MSAPNPEIVSRLYSLDPESFLAGPDALRRRDGSPATPEDVEAFKASTVADWEAATELWRLAVDQANYELDRQERISALCDKYQRDTDTGATTLDVIAARMSPADRAEFDRLWDELGNFLLITGES